MYTLKVNGLLITNLKNSFFEHKITLSIVEKSNFELSNKIFYKEPFQY